MKYALVSQIKSSPRPKPRGYCIHCGGEVIAKCGKIKVWHWAHKATDMCDPWWENETLWHRTWKGHFPEYLQEVGHVNPLTGEKHIADVKTGFGLVIEFQHSTLSVAERASREAFYRDMLWVVDGTRGTHDSAMFNKGTTGPLRRDPLLYIIEWWGRSRLLDFWSSSSKQVYLDFGTDALWMLVSFNPDTRRGVVGPVSKSIFIENCLSGRGMQLAFLDKNQDIEQFRLPRPLIEVAP